MREKLYPRCHYLLTVAAVVAWSLAGTVCAADDDHGNHADSQHATDQDHENGDHENGDHGAGHEAEGGHGAAHGGEHGAHSEPNPLAVDIDLALYTGVVFVLLLTVLGKFAWPVITAALTEREHRIEDSIASAEQKHEESKRLLAEHEAKLAHAADEVRELLEEARRDAEQTKNQILEDARTAANQERDRAIREVEVATDHAMKQLAEKSANLAASGGTGARSHWQIDRDQPERELASPRGTGESWQTRLRNPHAALATRSSTWMLNDWPTSMRRRCWMRSGRVAKPI